MCAPECVVWVKARIIIIIIIIIIMCVCVCVRVWPRMCVQVKARFTTIIIVCVPLLCPACVQVRAHSIIIATGATARRLGVPSEQAFWSKGISACAICDGVCAGLGYSSSSSAPLCAS